MEDLALGFPFPFDFEQRKQIGEPMPGPVVEFQPHRRNRAGEINAGNPGLKLCRRAVLVIPVKELLDRPGEQVGADIAEDRRLRPALFRGRRASYRRLGLTSRLEIVLDCVSNRLVLAQPSRCVTHKISFWLRVAAMDWLCCRNHSQPQPGGGVDAAANLLHASQGKLRDLR